ncbi:MULTISPECIES: DUF1302 domain-containing protein [Pseudomonadaceae]|uniref:DUF1302 domain-containing protein n=1 Tax=Pseudomonadaceae TaxID=135621 RepID=UPI0005C977BD|nr:MULTISPECIES: DUF1302 domain-containing protein [Pseudomonas]KIV73583.1 hypothetical protein SZ55_1330 [Pseudomonas sp. FeS53a]SFA66707.1 Protein of unknown function [Pseudomonas otitidis]
MTTTRKPIWRLARLPVAVSLASTLAAPAFGVTFNIGEIEGQFDSSLSVGASWSMASPDKDLIGSNNGGRGLSQTSDDSHLNFKRGETFSKIFKGIHDLELKYGDTGVFIRGKYWYDFELKDESRLFKDIDDHNRKEGAKSSGGQILDAFIYHNYNIADLPGSVRLGKQVVSWGESTFIGNSINSINPIDVSAFRRPGAEIKEGLIPVNMFYVSQSLTENLSAEAFYQLEWDQTVTDNCGTFFAQPDIVADGCTDNLRVLNKRSTINAALLPALAANNVDINEEGVLVRRGKDRDARDSGQWGTALRYFSDELNTEFGAFFMNYHSRAPIFSATGAPLSRYASVGPGGALTPLVVAGNSNYFIEYPEDIRLYGLSFSTTLPTGTAWSGEISYRPNAPVQLNTTDILYSGLTPLPGRSNVSLLSGVPGQDQHGYRRKEITQFQTTLTHFFDQVMGAERVTLVGEVGVVHVGGLESTSDVRYGRDPVFGPGPLPGTLPNSAGSVFPASASNSACVGLNKGTLNGSGAGTSPDNVSKYCEDDGYVTSTSWGYRIRAVWDYNDVFAGINLKPNVVWSHDVHGYGPNGLFTEGAKAVSLGMDAEYQNTYTASLSYTDFFGGKYNTLTDRDFLALSFGMNF